MGESGELVIGGVGLARYLDPDKDAEKFAPLPSLGWERAYRSGDLVRADDGRAAVPRARRRAGQARRPAHRAGRGRRRAAGAARRRRRGGGRAPHPGGQPGAGRVRGAEPPGASWTPTPRRSPCASALPAALVPLLAVVDDLPTRTSGKVDRDALPWPLPRLQAASGLDPVAAGLLTRTEGWLAEGWAEILGVPVTDPKADFFAHGGGSLAAAQLVARIRTRLPAGVGRRPLPAPEAGGARGPAGRARARPATRPRDVVPTPRRRGARAGAAHGADAGARRACAGRASPRRSRRSLAVAVPWAPHRVRGGRWWWPAACCSSARPGGSGSPRAAPGCCCAACARAATRAAARCTCGCGRPTRLAELSGATGVSGASWTTCYARALGAKIGQDVDLHSAAAGHRPAQDRARRGRRAGGGPRRLLGRRRRRCTSARSGSAPGATVGSRSTLLPGARIGKGAEIAAGSTVRGAGPRRPALGGRARAAVRRERRALAVGPARALARAGRSPTASRRCCSGCSPRWRRCLRCVIVAAGVAGTASAAEATRRSAAAGRPGDARVPVGVRGARRWPACACSASAWREGFHPVRSRAGWQVWATERLMDVARTGLFPLYASLFTPVWLRLLGAKVGRDVEASTVLAAAEDDHGRATARSSPTTPWSAPTSSPAAGCTSRRSRVGKRAFLGNSGMTAPGRSVPNRGLVGVLSATPRKAKKGSSWLGLPADAAAPGGRAAATTSRTFHPPRRLKIARAADRAVPGRAGDVLRRARRARRRAAGWRSRPPLGSSVAALLAVPAAARRGRHGRRR